MIELGNAAIALVADPAAATVVLEDRRRGCRWRLLPETRCCGLRGRGGAAALRHGRTAQRQPGVLREEFAVAGQVRLAYEWRLLADGVEVTLSCLQGEAAVEWASLPGSFVAEGAGLRLALPIMQGVLLAGQGGPAAERLRYGGHMSLSMAMLGWLAPGGGLLLANESATDWEAAVGCDASGSPYAYVVQTASLGALAGCRTARLYCTAGDVSALCKRYRRRVQERGPWVTWEQKMAARPAVERLFGALMAFIGYNQDEIDYVAACRRLRARGFDRAFVYPVGFNTYSRAFRMGGDPPIELSDAAIAEIRSLGFEVAPWTWVYEGLDDGSAAMRARFILDAAGRPIPHWRIDDFQWYKCCTPAQCQFVREQYRGPMAAMTWNHFDVNATSGPQECHALEHLGHPGRPLSRADDLAFLRELLGPATNGDRVVSSEGFRDCLADAYDIGTTKLLPAWGAQQSWTVPMVQLVYHDVIVQDWWELHNYNATGGFAHTTQWGCQRDGAPRLKAAMDALYGCPPNVFPFGKQYRWVDRAAGRTESFTVRLEEPSVQEALAVALPVAQAHRRTGPQELLSHVFLSADGAVQRTEFADGTLVFANFGDRPVQVPEAGQLDALSWKLL